MSLALRVAAIGMLMLSLGGASGSSPSSDSPPSAAIPAQLLHRLLSPLLTPAATSTGAVLVKPAAPWGVAVDGVDINVSVKTVRRTAEGIVPPETTLRELQTAYWWDERAAPGSPSLGTTFIVAHSCRKVHCAFDALPRAVINTRVIVTTPHGVLIYRVFRTASYPKHGKNATQSQPDVYESVKNRLVLVTCQLRSDGQRATDNFVAWATLDSAVR